MLALEEGLHYASEVVKIVGGLASFYAVYKLREIEKKYLFKATMPELITKLDSALSALSDALVNPASHRTEIAEALNYLMVDAKNIKRKARGDSLRACHEFINMVQTTRSKRFF